MSGALNRERTSLRLAEAVSWEAGSRSAGPWCLPSWRSPPATDPTKQYRTVPASAVYKPQTPQRCLGLYPGLSIGSSRAAHLLASGRGCLLGGRVQVCRALVLAQRVAQLAHAPSHRPHKAAPGYVRPRHWPAAHPRYEHTQGVALKSRAWQRRAAAAVRMLACAAADAQAGKTS